MLHLQIIPAGADGISWLGLTFGLFFEPGDLPLFFGGAFWGSELISFIIHFWASTLPCLMFLFLVVWFTVETDEAMCEVNEVFDVEANEVMNLP